MSKPTITEADSTEWTGSLQGQYAGGVIARIEGTEYVIYKED